MSGVPSPRVAPSPRERRLGVGKTNRSDVQVLTLAATSSRNGTPLLPPVPLSPSRPGSLRDARSGAESEGGDSNYMWHVSQNHFPPQIGPTQRTRRTVRRGTPLVDRIRRNAEKLNEPVIPLAARKPRNSSMFNKEVAANVTEKIRRTLANKTKSMHKVFRHYDADHSGNISLDEFQAALKGLNLPVSEDEVDILFHHIDKDLSGSIDYQEFCTELGEDNGVKPAEGGGLYVGGGEAALITKAEHLINGHARPNRNTEVIVEEEAPEDTAEALKWKNKSMHQMTDRERIAFTRSLLLKLKRKMVDKSSSALKLFRIYDKDKDGHISMNEFRDVLRGLNMKMNPVEMEAMVETVDRDGNGKLNYTEFCAQFAETNEDNGGESFGARTDLRRVDHSALPVGLSAVARQLHNGTHPISVPQLLKVMRSRDKARVGEITADEFKEGLAEVLGRGQYGVEQRDIDAVGWEEDFPGGPEEPIDYLAFVARVRSLSMHEGDYVKAAHLGPSAGRSYDGALDAYSRHIAGGALSDRGGSVRGGGSRGSRLSSMASPHSSRLPSRSGHVPSYDPQASWTIQTRPFYPRTETMHIFKPREGTAAFANDVVRHTTVNRTVADGKLNISPAEPPGAARPKEVKYARMRHNAERVQAAYIDQEARKIAATEKRYANMQKLRSGYIDRLLEQAIWHERFDHRDMYADIRYAPVAVNGNVPGYN